ncbi:hypothetical protein TRVL_03877 [Trypanosoma vivax]|nr:hypothetical protein TRVL_03877 [Trypanosoma vivax]
MHKLKREVKEKVTGGNSEKRKSISNIRREQKRFDPTCPEKFRTEQSGHTASDGQRNSGIVTTGLPPPPPPVTTSVFGGPAFSFRVDGKENLLKPPALEMPLTARRC